MNLVLSKQSIFDHFLLDIRKNAGMSCGAKKMTSATSFEVVNSNFFMKHPPFGLVATLAGLFLVYIFNYITFYVHLQFFIKN